MEWVLFSESKPGSSVPAAKRPRSGYLPRKFPESRIPILGKWLLTAIVNAYVLAGLFSMTGTATIGAGIMLAVVVWLGYGLTFSSWPVIFARPPTGVWFINNGGFLLMQIAMAIVLSLWK